MVQNWAMVNNTSNINSHHCKNYNEVTSDEETKKNKYRLSSRHIIGVDVIVDYQDWWNRIVDDINYNINWNRSDLFK